MQIALEDINALKASSSKHFQQIILVSYFWQPTNRDPLKTIVIQHQHHLVYKGF
jgi:hypothetical protein